MIPINSRKDIALVNNPVLQAGLEKEFDRLPKGFKYPRYGYFIVLETPQELEGMKVLEQIKGHFTQEPYTDYIEMIEPFDKYAQVVCLLDADFGVSLFVSEELMPINQLETLFGS